MSLFQSLRIGATGLFAAQTGIEVASENIARADDPQYSRVRLLQESVGYRDLGVGLLGGGVRVSDLMRARDVFSDARYRNDTAQEHQFAHLASTLRTLETHIDALSDQSIGAHLDRFWDGWLEVANAPGDSSASSDLVQRAGQLVDRIHALDRTLTETRTQMAAEVSQTTGQINHLTARIAGLNSQIATSGGNTPLPLLDARDAALDELSALADVEIEDGGDRIRLEGLTLVEGRAATDLTMGDDGTLRVGSGGPTVRVHSGTLAALIEERDEILPGVQNDLDHFAASLAEQVNSLHRTGWSADGRHGSIDFFSGDTARSIEVNSAIRDHPTRVATGGSGKSGDNSIALALGELRDQPLTDGRTLAQTFDDLAVSVGLGASHAIASTEIASAMRAQSLAQRQATQGVNLDEEMVDMIALQTSYQAAARVVSTVDQLIESTLAMAG